MFRLKLFLLALLLPGAAFAAQTVSLPAKRVAMNGDGQASAMWDLSAELRKLNIGKDKATGRLLQVDMKVKAGFTGATIGLMLGGVIVDSATVVDDNEATLNLGADSAITNPPWMLAVRGDVQFIEIRVTVDAAVDAPTTPEPQQPKPEEPQKPDPAPGGDKPPTTTPRPTPKPDPEPSNPTPTPTPTPRPSNPPPIPAGDLSPGQEVVAVSESSGRIDYVRIVRRERNGTYTVSFGGAEYGDWLRSQLGVLKGCSGSFCVGQTVAWKRWPQANDLKVVAILGTDGRSVVLESRSARDLAVANVKELSKPGGGTTTRPPTPAPVDRNPRNLRQGQFVDYVDGSNVVIPGQILAIDGRIISVALDSRTDIIRVEGTSDRIAVLEGCSARVCTGQMAVTSDRGGRTYEVTVVGLQSDNLVVVRINRTGQQIGNWPVSALQLW